MVKHPRKTVQLGELVAAFFDEAARYASDPEEVSRLATKAVLNLLRRARGTLNPRSPLPAHGRRSMPGARWANPWPSNR